MNAKQLHAEWCPNGSDCSGGCGFDKDIAAALAAAVAAERARVAPLVDAVAACFNKRGVEWADRKGNEDIDALADALSDYGFSLNLAALAAAPEGEWKEEDIPPMAHFGRFDLRRDEDTGRRYWFGSEDGWKDPTEIGEDGVLTISAEHFAIGTVLTLHEPTAPEGE